MRQQCCTAAGIVNCWVTAALRWLGPRNTSEEMLEYTESIGRLAARAGCAIISGGAKGVDQAAMHGALVAGGSVAGVLTNDLYRESVNREHRDALMEDQLVLVSQYDPKAGFNAGHAMQRNKLIYALADAGLVIDSAHNEGGTWAGAVEQLDKLRLVPVYTRSEGEIGAGLEGLRRKGASPWPIPKHQASSGKRWQASNRTRSQTFCWMKALPLNPTKAIQSAILHRYYPKYP